MVARSELPPARDDRFSGYLVLASVTVVIGLLTGRVEIMAIAAAVVAVALIGGRTVRTVTVETSATLSSGRLIEGDRVSATVRVRTPVTHDVSVALVETPRSLPGIAVVHSEVEPDTGDLVIRIEAPADRWGRYELGHLAARATTPTSMFSWQQVIGDLGRITVLPRAEHLDQMLHPAASQVSAGRHRSGLVGADGSEFADIRSYSPGDRLRDVNWKVSARRQELHVNRRHPERAGDVVIVLDAVPDGIWQQSAIGSFLLQSAGRAAWGLARHHLAAQDRVGVMIHQARGITWLPPRGGRRAQYRLLDRLIASTDPTGIDVIPRELDRQAIPPSALVIGISSLASDETLASFAALRTHGREVSVLAIDPSVAVERFSDLDAPATRLALMLHEARVSYLRRMSTPVVSWQPGTDIDRSIRVLTQLTERSSGRRVS